MTRGGRAVGVTAAALLAGGVAGAADVEPDARRSGADFMAPETRAMQADDASNPGMLWVLEGERLWAEPAGPEGRACATCHGDAARTMRGVAARYPAFDNGSDRPVDLAGRIDQCRQARQGAPPLARESDPLLALTAYVAHQSRGMPVAPPGDTRLDPFRENGRRLFQQPLGQLGLACANCHDERWDGRLGGAPITQAHPTAYPLYRLEWQALGSLQRRLRNCMAGVRAEPLPFGAPELIELELHLMQRAAGMPMETPGVRP
ncbi:sulfur oxidation c-type cytochrome SoxA [Azospirillum sp. RWY-5-1]|uniref:SoxAX cytochrome complex subunit A n=1 Tax=Azospirillum oleiclasticum TaxID=2735135 RepID=A0ABX2TCZ4_9PROT|nr:sulfur oxidation c-type cytochrome SoxA [Azospirillum oleiclasticum]NYZ13795.1 sulfur oxidation c-type cytochrome SoxA [Azospirillum oleiclasticum]NYZ21067.1 sulfur oxidation c-type cytochrome SoxA [Azospirillum oleiclasticum]